MNVGCRIANHTAVYVGNNHIIHHLISRPSNEENFSGSWRRRVMDVVRHPFVTEANNENHQTVDLIELLPDYVKLRYGIIKAVE